MDLDYLENLLNNFKNNKISLDKCIDQLKKLPYENIDFAKLDNHRLIRKGSAEVVYCQNKTPSQILKIISVLIKYNQNILLTRLEDSTAKKICKKYPKAIYNNAAKTMRFALSKKRKNRKGNIKIITAGTADINVAEECAETLKALRMNPETIYDVGVAGVHRLFGYMDKLLEADVIIAIAGMEGALPSVVAGLVSSPVIAVPTSIGYGTHFNGMTPLLSMLNSCSTNIAVVNIDNGFGAGYFASTICNKIYSDL